MPSTVRYRCGPVTSVTQRASTRNSGPYGDLAVHHSGSTPARNGLSGALAGPTAYGSSPRVSWLPWAP